MNIKLRYKSWRTISRLCAELAIWPKGSVGLTRTQRYLLSNSKRQTAEIRISKGKTRRANDEMKEEAEYKEEHERFMRWKRDFESKREGEKERRTSPLRCFRGLLLI
jgi:hypothetical protein